jgi:hypothetical protein
LTIISSTEAERLPKDCEFELRGDKLVRFDAEHDLFHTPDGYPSFESTKLVSEIVEEDRDEGDCQMNIEKHIDIF